MAEKRKHDEIEQDETDPVVSLQDIIEEDTELESTANAVLGGSDDQECTYNEGYMKRQALYACATCKTTDSAGVCLACSLDCHEGHELYELYTKRNFRCDCGNDKFEDFKCNFHPDKDSTNEGNTYNHNFKGVYCTCDRPYPDPEDSIDDEMIQCIICEDWFHSRHLHGKGIPDGSDFSEMICHMCMENKTQFLWFYNWEYTHYESAIVDVLESPSKDKKEDEISDNTDLNGSTNLVKIEEKCSDASTNSETLNEISNKELQSTTIDKKPTANSIVTTMTESKVDEINKAEEVSVSESEDKIDATNTCDTNINQANEKKAIIKSEELNTNGSVKKEPIYKKEFIKSQCRLEYLKQVYNACKFPDSAAFWPDVWRNNLCKCEKCKILMKDFSYLTQKDDTVAEYEEKGAAKQPDSTMDKGMRALGGMNRIQQVEVIQGYNEMKSKLSDYLRTFAQDGRVVTEEDIRNFFKNMNETKKPRLGISHSCK
uniref:putative E3 ubiquitin-protein ligase UBR7 n=1 Tax=Styela clava TaxID=7725 RepID=UPI0019394D88|nr:putative E3 ubiquitin-protein ligase UBR7 [Styela clava]